MIELGKYAGTVLGAWGVTLALLAGITVQSIVRDIRARHALEAEEPRRRG